MPYDSKKQKPDFWRKAEMLSIFEAQMNAATSMTELRTILNLANSMSKTVPGFSRELIIAKDRNKKRIYQESEASDLASRAFEVAVKATLVDGPTCDPGEKGVEGLPGEADNGQWFKYGNDHFRWRADLGSWERESDGTFLANFVYS